MSVVNSELLTASIKLRNVTIRYAQAAAKGEPSDEEWLNLIVAYHVVRSFRLRPDPDPPVYDGWYELLNGTRSRSD
jgi:hypothetical protein